MMVEMRPVGVDGGRGCEDDHLEQLRGGVQESHEVRPELEGMMVSEHTTTC